MAKTNLGRVVGLSAFEEWKIKNPEGTWEQFMESLKGPGVQGFEFKEELENGDRVYDVILEGNIKSGTITIGPGKPGKSIYEIWLEQGNTGTEEEFFNSLIGVGIKDKEFIKFDTEGNAIYRDVYSNGTKSSEYISPRGPRGYTGGTDDNTNPIPPGTVPYGTILEWEGTYPPEGFVYANGGTLDKKRYPHLANIFEVVVTPEIPFFQVGQIANYMSSSIKPADFPANAVSPSRLTCEKNGNKANVYCITTGGSLESTEYCGYSIFKTAGFYMNYERNGAANNTYYYVILNKELTLSSFIVNKKNALGMNGGYTSDSVVAHWTLDIEYKDKNGDWIKGTEVASEKDFTIEGPGNHKTALLKNYFKSKEFRFKVNIEKSKCRFINPNTGVEIYLIGNVNIGFTLEKPVMEEQIKLPTAIMQNGKYKIVFVGEPLAPAPNPTIYTYNKSKIETREISLTKALDNKIPYYADGITFSEPSENKLGYTNKYRKEKNIWELEKTHLNKEGYYYDENEDLRYTPKPSICHIFDFNAHTWVFSQEKKENALKSILEDIALKKMQKETMIELNLNLSKIDIEIENLKKEIEEVKKINE